LEIDSRAAEERIMNSDRSKNEQQNRHLTFFGP
ncbi:hypothetical protein LCGC14_1478980, partial [marine sediment metagenome]